MNFTMTKLGVFHEMSEEAWWAFNEGCLVVWAERVWKNNENKRRFFQWKRQGAGR